jgi:RimJ/RimL family protein N-acetyltransferase
VSRAAALEGLRLRTPRLELRLARDDDLEELYDAAMAGIHPPDEMPFGVAWTDGLGEPGRRQGFIDYHLEALAGISPDRWHLLFCARERGRPVGVQGVEAERFADERRVDTGSWLTAAAQGRGLGTEMRAAVLELAFGHLGARVAGSGAVDGNVASRRVSDKLGYEEVGRSTVAPRGVEVGHANLELTPEAWRAARSIPVEVHGVTPELLALLGAG